MPRKIDMTGNRYGRLVVIEEVKTDKSGIKWRCRCDCGKEVVVLGSNLRNGYTKSCGCYQKEQTSNTSKKHGNGKTKLYGVWKSMKRRCNNPNTEKFKHYGGRGIKVCEEWLNDFMAFYEWSMKNGYREGLTLDRKNVDGDYTPENCRWTTQKGQQNNRRNNHLIEFNGETHTMKEWAEIKNINYGTLARRINIDKWPIEKALNTK